MLKFRPFVVFTNLLFVTGCWVWYTDNPKYRPEITNAHPAPPSGPVSHVSQWVGQMYDARLSLEILDARCPTPTVYSDLEFQIRRKDKVLLKRSLEKRAFDEKVYMEKGEYEAVLISFSRSEVVASKSFLFEGQDKRLSLEVKCRS